MNPHAEVILKTAAQEVCYAQTFAEDLPSTKQTNHLWLVWSGFLDHYVKAVSAMRRASNNGKSKGWSDKLLDEQRKDHILKYAFEARNHANHSFEEKREARSKSISLAGSIFVSGNSNGMLSGNVVVRSDGKIEKLAEGRLVTENGRYAGGSIPKNAFEEHEHYCVVKDVNTRSGICSVPNPETPPSRQAIEIAEYVVSWLKVKLKEAQRMADSEL